MSVCYQFFGGSLFIHRHKAFFYNVIIGKIMRKAMWHEKNGLLHDMMETRTYVQVKDLVLDRTI